MGFLGRDELEAMGFRSIGKDVKVSTRASIHGAGRIDLGDHSRIDDFCVLSAGIGGIQIGRYVHVACFASLIGSAPIRLADFSGLSSRVALYSSSDDYGGDFLTNPTVPQRFTNVITGPVSLGRHVIIGVSATVLPGVEIGEGSAVGAYSLVTRNVAPGIIVAGVPAKRIKDRRRGMFDLERELVASEGRESGQG